MKIKHLTRWAAALGMTAVLLCGAAFAAEENTIAVQLNGEELTFTDAVPQVKDQRTFLPFRAVFEAMGAEVSNEGNIITAVQGDRKLTMTIGETAATVTQLGVELPITMDVAPYVDTNTWRTYVPVRFAAQAFGYTVGWDQEAYTAILIDPVKVLNEAMEGKEFTYLEKLTEYTEKYNEGIWDMTMDMEGAVAIQGLMMGTMGEALPLSATVQGTVQDEMKMSMDMNVKVDITDYIQSVELLFGGSLNISEEGWAAVDSLAKEGIGLSLRGDMNEGKLYVMLNGSPLESVGIPRDTWFLMDMNALFSQAGLNDGWKQMMTAAQNISEEDAWGYVRAYLTTLLPDLVGQEALADADTAYAQCKAVMSTWLEAVADDAFVKDGDDYTATMDILKLMGEEIEGAEGTLALTITMRRNEAVGYAIEMNMAATNEEMGDLSMKMTVSMDDKDQMEASMSMDMGGLMNMDFAMNAKYTAGKTAPEVTPPAGAVVLPLAEMMGLMDAYGPAAE